MYGMIAYAVGAGLAFWLIDVPPELSADYFLDAPARDIHGLRDSGHAATLPVIHRPNGAHDIWIQARIEMIDALPSAPLGVAIIAVVLGRAGEQVSYIDASPVVARMADHEPRLDRPKGPFICDAMRAKSRSVDRDSAVAVDIYGAAPFYAIADGDSIFSKLTFNCITASFHDARTTVGAVSMLRESASRFRGKQFSAICALDVHVHITRMFLCGMTDVGIT